MTRTLTPQSLPTATADQRATWWFRAVIALVVAAVVGLVLWTFVQRPIDGAGSAAPAPAPQSIRQVEHAAEVRAALEHLDDTEVRRFANRAGAAAVGRPDAESLGGLERAEVQRFGNRVTAPDGDGTSVPARRRPGVQP